MNATSKPSILTDRPVSTPVPNFQTKVSLPPASEALVAFRDTENYSSRCLPQLLSMFTLANMVLSLLIVMKPRLPVSLSFIWMPN